MLLFVIGAVVFIGVIVLFFAIGIGTIRGANKRAEIYTAETEGIVTGVREHTSKEGHNPARYVTYFYPVFQYFVDGVEYQVLPRTGHTNDTHFIGEKAVVHYNPNNPEEASVLEEDDVKFGRSVVIFMTFFVSIWIAMFIAIAIVL